ncbi:MAG: glycosyltransferase family 2 protein [Conexivisphaera sp.]
MQPLLSIIMLNYNGAKIMDIVREAVESVKVAGYDSYEFILVDNGSTDGSYEAISKYVESAGLVRTTVVRSERNLGFTGGNNLGFRARSKGSEYTLLLNNDAVLLPGSLGPLMALMRKNLDVGALNGAILDYGSGKLVGVPSFVDEMCGVVAPMGADFSEGAYRAVEETYPMGAAALLRNEAVLEANRGRDQVFDEELFIYFDDTTLGLKLWNSGWRVEFHPVPVAKHLGGSSSPSALGAYHMIRGRAALCEAAPPRYRRLAGIYLRRNAAWASRTFGGSRLDFRRALEEGRNAGRALRDRYRPDFYRAPVVRLSTLEAIRKALISAGGVGRRKSRELLELISGASAERRSGLLIGGPSGRNTAAQRDRRADNGPASARSLEGERRLV